jgi:hypothetical protein
MVDRLGSFFELVAFERRLTRRISRVRSSDASRDR